MICATWTCTIHDSPASEKKLSSSEISISHIQRNPPELVWWHCPKCPKCPKSRAPPTHFLIFPIFSGLSPHKRIVSGEEYSWRSTVLITNWPVKVSNLLFKICMLIFVLVCQHLWSIFPSGQTRSFHQSRYPNMLRRTHSISLSCPASSSNHIARSKQESFSFESSQWIASPSNLFFSCCCKFHLLNKISTAEFFLLG